MVSIENKPVLTCKCGNSLLVDLARHDSHATGINRSSLEVTQERIHESEHAYAPTTKLQAYTADDDVIAVYTVHLRATASTAGTNN